MREFAEKKLGCGHVITFGSCGAAGAADQITHQKDPQMVAAYDDFFRVVHPTFRPASIFEIGVCRGGSLEIWREMFPTATRIVGVDNNLGQLQPQTLSHYSENARIAVYHLEMPDAAVRKFGAFDLIVDDGGHGPKATFPAFELCWPMLNPGGIYVVEDWHQEFLEPHRQMQHFAAKMIGDWTAAVGPADAPLSITAYRAFFAMRKRG